MKIYSMTATFGKLENRTLTLTPGLNIIQAPNEWGKSTWCAFLTAMLYGIETRTHTTKTVLAEKERYAPWSGKPMSGRMDISWNGRDITIERRSKGRVVFGDFSAYETHTGIPVPELNAANCGQMLLGVEKSVFLRSGFIRMTELPVTQDEALRRRLNALVTTGDESGTADRLEKQLRDLKNRIRYHKSGLLPQAQLQLDEVQQKAKQLEQLTSQHSRLKSRAAALEDFGRQLENHRAALRYAAAQQDSQRIAQAVQRRDELSEQLTNMEQNCAKLPGRDETAAALRHLRNLQEQWESVQMEAQMLPQPAQQPPVPDRYRGRTPEDALQQAREDEAAYGVLVKKKKNWNRFLVSFVLVSVLLCGGLAAAWFGYEYREPMLYWIAGSVLAAGAVAVLIAALIRSSSYHRKVAALYQRHGGSLPDQWVTDAQAYAQAQLRYRETAAAVLEARGDLDGRMATLTQQIRQTCGTEGLQKSLYRWEQIWQCHEAMDSLRREYRGAAGHVKALQAMARTAPGPAFADRMTYSEEETRKLLADTAAQLRQLQLQLGQCQGQMETLGSPAQLHREQEQLQQRIRKLTDTLDALTIAQQTLGEATQQLQRRFAPKITARARELFGKLTLQRYDRLTIGQDLSLQAGAAEETVLRSAQWRSEGTADQLYLALRLAVAEALTPNAPLVLDDALVRFDDTRLKVALEVLQEMAGTTQVILFTCQSREKELIK